MLKWAVLVLLIGMVAGVGLWLAQDAQARASALNTWNAAMTSITGGKIEVNGASLMEPITKAFEDFADSVSALWSPNTIQIQAPSIQPGQ